MDEDITMLPSITSVPEIDLPLATVEEITDAIITDEPSPSSEETMDTSISPSSPSLTSSSSSTSYSSSYSSSTTHILPIPSKPIVPSGPFPNPDASPVSRVPKTCVYSWGLNQAGQLMHGDCNLLFTPRRVARLEAFKSPIAAVACGDSHSVVVSEGGDVWVAGANEEGQLSVCADIEKDDHSSLPLPTKMEATFTNRVLQVACGRYHTVCLLESGTPISFGMNDLGQCGQKEGQLVVPPRVVRGLNNNPVAQVACGESHTLFLTQLGQVFSCGDGAGGALGLPSPSPASSPSSSSSASSSSSPPPPVFTATPVPALSATPVVFIAAGQGTSAAVTATGRLLTWGRNKHGQLGHGHFSPSELPRAVNLPLGSAVRQVAVGGFHMLAVTQESTVYAWGRGDRGQLGTGSTASSPTPLLVAIHSPVSSELPLVVSGGGGQVQVRARQVAAGLNHSLILTESGKVLAFGAADLGQCGIEDSRDKCFPVPLENIPANISAFEIAAGGDHSLLLAVEDGSLLSRLPGSWAASRLPVFSEQQQGRWLKQQVDHAVLMDNFKPLSQLLSSRLSSLCSINASFLLPLPVALASDLAHVRASAVDCEAVEGFFRSVLQSYSQQLIGDVARCFDAALTHLLNLPEPALLLPESWRVLLIALQNPLLASPSNPLTQSTFSHASALIQRMHPSVFPAMALAFSRYPQHIFVARILRPILNVVESVLAGGQWQGKTQWDALMLVKWLWNLNSINKLVPEEEFYIERFSTQLDLKSHLVFWLQRGHQGGKVGPSSFCILDFPFLLDVSCKRKLIRLESSLVMSSEMQSAALRSMFTQESPYFVLPVRRDHLLQDALNVISMADVHTLHKPLKVVFQGEEAVDEGGVTKEFFQLVVREVFHAKYGLFSYDEDSRTHWLPVHSHTDQHLEYALVGTLWGLAIYNGVILDVHFPLTLFKKLLGEKVGSLEDLTLSHPSLAKGLQQMLAYEQDDLEDVFMASFAVDCEYLGDRHTHELKPNGANIPVTKESRQEYISLYGKWILEDSVSAPFRALSAGFWKVCGAASSTRLVSASELQQLVCGIPHLDFAQLQANTKYDGGFSADSPQIVWFWQWVKSLELEDKKKLLRFITGSDRAPVGGLASLNLIIQRNGPDCDRLPTAYTCFNILLLPEYSSEQKLVSKLNSAIQFSEGFGLR